MTINVLRNTEYGVTTTLIVWECPSCGIVYGIPKSFADTCRAEGRGYWCPNGHKLSWAESEEDRLRKKLEREQRRAAQLVAELDQETASRRSAQRRVTAMKGVVTKTKKRIAAGKCVRCTCEFPDLAAHMAEAHPDYAPEEDT